MRIEVKIPKEDKTLDVYVFTTFDTNAVFIGFNKQFKPEGKKVWRVECLWDKYDSRSSKIDEPELTDEVRKLAFDEMVKNIKVQNWKEFKSIK
jgi:hypothetical protein